METMNRRRRTRILVLGPAELRASWAEAVRQNHTPEVLEPPRAGLVMVPVREGARRSLFNLGEVLVTEAKVRVAGVTGVGLVRGWDEAAAGDLAVIDAACRAGLPVNGPFFSRLAEAEQALDAGLASERAVLESSRVDFQTLDQGVLS